LAAMARDASRARWVPEQPLLLTLCWPSTRFGGGYDAQNNRGRGHALFFCERCSERIGKETTVHMHEAPERALSRERGVSRSVGGGGRRRGWIAWLPTWFDWYGRQARGRARGVDLAENSPWRLEMVKSKKSKNVMGFQHSALRL